MKIRVLLIGIAMLLGATLSQAQNAEADARYIARDYKMAAKLYAKNWSPGASAEHTARLVDSYTQIADYEGIYSLLKEEIPGRFAAEVILAGGHAARSIGDYDLAEKWYKAYYRHDADGARRWVDVLDYARSQVDQPALYQVSPALINTPHSDYAATVKGNSVIWTSHRSDIVRTDKRKEQEMNIGSSQLYQSQKVNGSFGAERFLRADIKDVHGNAQIHYDLDGRIAAYVQHISKKDGISKVDPLDRTQGIYIALSDPQTGDWSIDEAFPFNSTEYSCAYPYIMNNGRTLYFASNRPDSYGGFDLYVSHKVGGKWSIPKNLGSEINTPENEISPIINNGQLYFASQGHPGLGGFDIFRAEVINGEYGRIFNIGKDVNSGYDDFDLFLDPRGSLGLFTSNRPGGMGAEDIYHCKKIGNQIKVVVRDAQTKQPLANAEIHVDNRSQPFLTGYYGDCALNISENGTSSIRVFQKGYLGKMVPVTIDVNSHLIKTYDVFLNRDPNAGAMTSKDPVKEDTMDAAAKAAEEARKQQAMINEKNRAEAERQRTLEAQRLEAEKAKTQSKTLDELNRAEAERQRALEAQRKKAEAEMAKLKQLEEEQARAEAEKKRQMELERKRAEEAEKKRQMELERQRAAEAERKRIAEEEKRKRLEEERKRAEAERQRALEEQRKRQAEAEKQRRMEAEQRRLEAEKKRMEEQKALEAERRRIQEAERQRRAEAERRLAEEMKRRSEPVSTTTTNVQSVYAVQLASLSESGADIDLTPYKQLYDLGTIYKLNKGIGVKIRLGTFKTESEARSILNRVRQRGYPDAYLVIQDDEMALQAPPARTEPRATAPASTTTPARILTTSPSNTRVFPGVTEGYKIRMAALSDLSNFSDTAVRDLGHIEVQKKESASVIYIAGFMDYQSALNALQVVKRKGYRDAYIVLYRDGVFKAIR